MRTKAVFLLAYDPEKIHGAKESKILLMVFSSTPYPKLSSSYEVFRNQF